jgi:23S rRNA pseudouridine2605 synthase
LPETRLNKILAHAGVASRRAAEKMIASGRVSVDGYVVRDVGFKADPARQKIMVDGKSIYAEDSLEYWLVHKPRGVLSTASDPQGRPTVLKLVPKRPVRLYPVGRLDMDSEGLMLLTNDGELANRITHPRYEVEKRYRVWVKGEPNRSTLNAMRKGVELDDGFMSAPARVHIKSGSRRGSKLAMVLKEGKKREIRRICEAVGHPVTRLVRVAIGPLKLGEIPLGASRQLRPGEIKYLRQSVGLR